MVERGGKYWKEVADRMVAEGKLPEKMPKRMKKEYAKGEIEKENQAYAQWEWFHRTGGGGST